MILTLTHESKLIKKKWHIVRFSVYFSYTSSIKSLANLNLV